MLVDCHGIVIRQTKALKGRRIILLLTDRLGKISAGTNISEKAQGRARNGGGGSALAVRPFTYGRYTLRRERGFTNISRAETVKSYYPLGEDYTKYVNASLVLEFAGKMLPEDAPAPELYADTLVFLNLMEKRSRAHRTLTAAWLVKALNFAGVLPDAQNYDSDKLISALGFDKLEALTYLIGNPIEKMSGLALDDDIAGVLIRTLLRFAEQHLEITNLKSESVFTV